MQQGVILQTNKDKLGNLKPIFLTSDDIVNLRNKRINELPDEKVYVSLFVINFYLI
jgi:hypothetical protein